MKTYGFIASASEWVKGYVDAETPEEAIKKIMRGEYDDIIDSGGDDIYDVTDLWECE